MVQIFQLSNNQKNPEYKNNSWSGTPLSFKQLNTNLNKDTVSFKKNFTTLYDEMMESIYLPNGLQTLCIGDVKTISNGFVFELANLYSKKKIANEKVTPQDIESIVSNFAGKLPITFNTIDKYPDEIKREYGALSRLNWSRSGPKANLYVNFNAFIKSGMENIAHEFTHCLSNFTPVSLKLYQAKESMGVNQKYNDVFFDFHDLALPKIVNEKINKQNATLFDKLTMIKRKLDKFFFTFISLCINPLDTKLSNKIDEVMLFPLVDVRNKEIGKVMSAEEFQSKKLEDVLYFSRQKFDKYYDKCLNRVIAANNVQKTELLLQDMKNYAITEALAIRSSNLMYKLLRNQNPNQFYNSDMLPLVLEDMAEYFDKQISQCRTIEEFTNKAEKDKLYRIQKKIAQQSSR